MKLSLWSCIITLSFILGSYAKATPYTPYTYSRSYYACNYEISLAATFCPRANTTCLCSNKAALATYAGCLAYDNRNQTKTLEYMAETCKEANVTLPENWFSNSLSYYESDAKTASEIPNFNKSIPITVPFKLNTTEMETFKVSYDKFLGNYDDSLYWSTAILGYWLLIFVIGAGMNWSKFLFPNLYKKATGPFINYWRKHITMPATFSKKKSQEQRFLKIFDFLIPSRFESIVLVIFYLLVIIVNCPNTESVPNDPVFSGSEYRAQWRYAADRTGIIATFITPFVYLLAGRNNFLQWLTGWNFNTFITFHKHTARVMFVLVAIHAVGFTILLIGRYAAEMEETYMIWGTIATVAGGIILVQAMLFFRRRWYEVFLLIHILMAVFWLAGTWIHVEELGYIQMVYPAAAVWVFDRVVRIARLIVFGFPNATVTLESNDTIKIVVPKPKYWKSIPGGHAFVHFLKPLYFWQSHPFTFTEELDANHIVFFAKIKGGVTHSLYKLLANAPGRTCQIRVGVEGPYGEATAAKYADTPVFIAGGNGIPGIYSEALDIAKKLPQEKDKVVKLNWIVREYSNLFWFHNELMLLKDFNIQTTVYVTKPDIHTDLEQFNTRYYNKEDSESVEKEIAVKEDVKGDIDSTETNSVIESLKSELSHVTILEGRPDLEHLMANEVLESNGSVAFVACGHPVMVDEARYQATQMVTKSNGKRIDFYEQLQVWA